MACRILGIVLLSALAVFGNGCSQQPESEHGGGPAGTVSAPQAPSSGPRMQSVSPAQARELIRTRKDLLVVDVRTPGELRTGVIAGSLKVPFWAVMRGQHELPRDKALLLVCAVGGRSYAASQILVRNGYPEVYNLSGGIAAWKKAGFPLTEP